MALNDDRPESERTPRTPSEPARKGSPRQKVAVAAGPSTADGFNLWAFAGTLVGWLLLLLGQRVFAPMEGLAKICTWVAVLLLLASFGQRIWAMLEAPPDRHASSRAFAVLSALGISALALYAATTEWGHGVFGIDQPKVGEPDTFNDVLTVAYVALLVTSVVPTILGEIARQSMIRAEHVEGRRIIAAVVGGVTVALALVYGSLFTYGSGRVDWSADFSFFRVAAPSESTERMLEGVEEPVQARIYFPPQSEVGQKVAQYLTDLAAKTGKLEVAVHDRLLVPDLAKEDKVRQDGVVVLARGAQSEQLSIGTEEARAAATLRKLDGEFQTVLLKVLRDKRTAYLTVGHGELNEETDPKTNRTVRIVRELLESQNYGIKNLGLKEGLGSEVPDDATVVFVLGPTTPFSDAEIETLRRYANGGGALFIALDPESREPELAKVAAVVGVKWQADLVINDQVRFAVERGPADKKHIAAGTFSSHASVSSLSKLAQRGAAVLLAGSGPLEALDGGGYQIDPAVKSPAQSYLDPNGNWTFDVDGEKKAVFNLVVAATRPLDPGQEGKKGVTGPETRAIVVGDAGAFTDPFMQVAQTNQLLFLDAFRWLGGEESYIGAMSEEEDVRIVHTQEEDQLWFYGAILGMPGLVLGTGLLFTRRRRKKTAHETTNEGDRPRRGKKRARAADAASPAAGPSAEKSLKGGDAATRPRAQAAEDEVAEDEADDAREDDGAHDDDDAPASDDDGRRS